MMMVEENMEDYKCLSSWCVLDENFFVYFLLDWVDHVKIFMI